MPVWYIYMPVFGIYTCPQIRLSACLNRLFSMFADGRELQKSIVLNMPTRAALNTAKIYQLNAILYTGSFLEGVGEEEDVREDKEDAEDYINHCNCAPLNQLHLLLYCNPLPLYRLSSLNYSICRLLP